MNWLKIIIYVSYLLFEHIDDLSHLIDRLLPSLTYVFVSTLAGKKTRPCSVFKCRVYQIIKQSHHQQNVWRVLLIQHRLVAPWRHMSLYLHQLAEKWGNIRYSNAEFIKLSRKKHHRPGVKVITQSLVFRENCSYLLLLVEEKCRVCSSIEILKMLT